MKRKRSTLPSATALAIALAVAFAPAASLAPRAAHAASSRYLTTFMNFYTTLTRNFNPLIGQPDDFTLGGIYEPLYIITTAGGGHVYPWLATSYTWADGGKSLIVTVRHGVRWSDGTPMTAADVAFTFTYGKQYPAVDQTGLWASGHLLSVTTVGSDQVKFRFSTVDSTVLPLVFGVKVIPQHIWSKITHPDTYTNPDPVGTGPFARVASFSSQEYILGKNPYYWQPGKPSFDGIRVPAYTGNDSANLAMVKGELDWTQDFVPDVQRVYVSRDPAHFHYFYASDAPPTGLFLANNTYPYSLVGFRKALSYDIDRQRISLIAEYGYQPPSDAIGLAAAWPTWSDPALAAQAKDLATYNPAKAHALLAQLGFTWPGGHLTDPRGHAVALQLATPASYTDWVLAYQILERDFQALGINVTVKQMSDNAWNDAADKGLVQAHFHWVNGGSTPYYYFYSYMSKESYVPVGQDASISGQTNWQHTWSPQATALLAQYRQTTDAGKQHAIVDQLQKLQLDQFPYIPIMYSAYWYTYSTLRFTGWPTPSNYYAIGSTVQYPDNVKVLTTIVPVK